ncbi:MAG: hypothetical protein R2824_09745 [Saprospiraceae bacterium]|nr:hypothetical protein [Lewinella sp.]
MTQPSRLMFIAWNWHTIANTLNEVVQLNPHPMGIQEWKDKAFDELDVVVKKSDDKIVPDADRSKVIRINVADKNGFGMLPHILEIVTAYQNPGQKSFLFLHRSDGFRSKEVKTALQNMHVDKCFLFSDGRDFIYYPVQQIGLLSGAARRFFYQPAENGQSEVRVADERKKIVFQPHFDRVWHYYEHEFQTKIIEIRTDLLYFLWTKTFPGDQIWSAQQFQDLFQADRNETEKIRMLYLRIKNLLDKRFKLTQDEKGKLIAWEEKQQKSFVFDDCRENMTRLKGVRSKYEILHDKMMHLFFDAKSSYAEQKTVNEHLRDLQIDFDNLLLAVEESHVQ